MLTLIPIHMAPILFDGVVHNICTVFAGGMSSKSVTGEVGQKTVMLNQHCSSIFYPGMTWLCSLGSKCSIHSQRSRTTAICVDTIVIVTSL